MRDGFDKPELYGLVGKQTQGPTRMAIRRARASESGDLGTHLPVNGWRFARTWFIKQGRVESVKEVTPFDIKDGSRTELESLGDLVWVMPTMQKVEDTGASLRASRS